MRGISLYRRALRINRNALEMLALAFGLALISFMLGIAAALFKLPPYKVAEDAYKAVRSITKPDESYAVRRTTPGDGVIVSSPKKGSAGYIFLTHFRPDGYVASLLAANGKFVHQWEIPYSKVWPDAPHLEYQAPDISIMMIGAHLFPTGDVLFTYQGGNHPFGGGLVKIDTCSRLIWSLPVNAHHYIHVEENGNAYIPIQKLHKTIVIDYPWLKPPFYEDFVIKVSPDGKIINEISMLKAIHDSSREGVLIRGPGMTNREDPLHLNDVDVLGEDSAKMFPIFRTGDLLVSFRNINTIAIIDGNTDRVKWSMTGPFLDQHDPDFLPNGNILVFDNRPVRSKKEVGVSRLVEIDPVTQKIIWEYSGTQDKPFYTERSGNVAVLENGDLLVSAGESGRVFELTKDKEITWEFINGLNEHKVGEVSQVQHIPPEQANFLTEECPG